MTTLTLVIPCYEEEDALPPLFERLAELKAAFDKGSEGERVALDVLFVDDGSSDRTPEILAEIPAGLHPARVVTHDTNRNLGAALRTGFTHATGQWVATMDADCTYDPLYLVEMMRLVGLDVDLVTGSEYHPEGRVENVSWPRLLPSVALSWIYRLVLLSRLHSFSCLLRVHRRDGLCDILPASDGFLSCTEILVRAARLGYRIVEFPLVLTEREHGDSKMPTIRTVFEHLGFLTSIVLGRLPRRPTGGDAATSGGTR